ncbi:YadA-like family protein [Pasteurella atlantica]|uniref:YadA-like family protein n=1 Tax=Pasteurellaceae TaxID=712 RepID=UPI00275668D6|nr:YadA-like family protein [Pasteurella atlantica]MDP8034226.1 YadA-like family protein [Pasteurella atlantica]MDP8036111.1 YadA-like family protein [Pasteurella atlantica]MDP8038061.1 YadA-like family protein [Pasteurella atlantica]MDP8048416.1 YadA-like family protein [Pasteurella atlantica]MDP8050373.1 YadA-like family protein [Pasteurella atlantica]
MNTKNNKKTTVATLLFLSLTTSFAFAEPSQQEQIDALIKQVEGLQKQLQKLTAQPKIQTYATTTPDSTDDPAKNGTGTGSIVLNNGTAEGTNSIVGGSSKNSIEGNDNINSAVIGGNKNKIIGSKQYNGIFAGYNNTITNANHRNAIIGGQESEIIGTDNKQGFDNVIIGGGNTDGGGNSITDGDNNSIIGGYNNKITGVADRNYQDDNIILGGHTNAITKTAKDSAILGGAGNVASGKASVVIGGGFYESGKVVGNTAAGLNSSVMGGVENSVSATGFRSSVIGGYKNSVSSEDSITLGGQKNTITNSGISNAIFVGEDNTIENVNKGNVIIGGAKSKIHGGTGYDNFILGGGDRHADGNEIINGDNNVIIGGYGSKIVSDGKYYDNAIILGGRHNKIDKKTKNGFILGGTNNTVNGLLSGSLGGRGNNITGNGSYAIGGFNPEDTKSKSVDKTYGNTISGNNSYAMGNKNNISGHNSYAFGSDNKINSEKIYILGSGVDARGKKDAVVLGNNSTAENYAISVGSAGSERYIKHVKAGLADTDAANTTQLTQIDENVAGSEIAVNKEFLDGNGANTYKGRKYKLSLKDNSIAERKLTISLKNKIDNIEKNTTKIGENTTKIGENTTKIGENTTKIGENTTKIGENTTKIGENTTKIGENTTKIGENTTKIGENTTKIGENTTKIGENTTKIGENTTKIGENTTKIGENTTKIGENTTKIGENTTKIGQNTTKIGQNTTKIGENTKAIASKLSKDDMKGVLSSKTISVTGNGANQLLDNIKIEVKTDGQVADGDKKVVNGGTVKKYLDDNHYTKTKTNELLDKKVNSDDMNKSITGKGIKVGGAGRSQLLGAVTLEIEDNAITTAKIKDKNVTKDKLSDDVQTTLTQVETNKSDIANNSKNVTANTKNIASNKAAIDKKLDADKMKGELTSNKDSIKVTGKGKKTLLNDVNVEVNPTLTGMQNISFNNGVSIGQTGLNNGGHKITNVAAGEVSATSTDAVNGSQLYKIASQLNQNSNEAKKRAISGAAIAGAMANLPQEYLPGRSMVAVGTAHYRGTTAVSLGLSTISDNGKWILKGSVSSDLREETMVGAGAGYSW